MTLMTYKPEANDRMINLFDNFLYDDFFKWNIPNKTNDLNYDVIENDNEYVLDLGLPGFKKEDISLSVDDNILTIESERNADEKINYNRKGNFYGKYKKSFTLPEEVLAEKIDASFENGILSIKIPKNEKMKLSKTIEIK